MILSAVTKLRHGIESDMCLLCKIHRIKGICPVLNHNPGIGSISGGIVSYILLSHRTLYDMKHLKVCVNTKYTSILTF